MAEPITEANYAQRIYEHIASGRMPEFPEIGCHMLHKIHEELGGQATIPRERARQNDVPGFYYSNALKAWPEIEYHCTRCRPGDGRIRLRQDDPYPVEIDEPAWYLLVAAFALQVAGTEPPSYCEIAEKARRKVGGVQATILSELYKPGWVRRWGAAGVKVVVDPNQQFWVWKKRFSGHPHTGYLASLASGAMKDKETLQTAGVTYIIQTDRDMVREAIAEVDQAIASLTARRKKLEELLQEKAIS